LRLKINDDGEQVSDLARVFEPDAILSDEPDVNDLGIIIGRKLIEIMNGRLWIRNIDSGGLETIVEVSSRPAKA
jgi:K+-sensing histidine kinase KdpD